MHTKQAEVVEGRRRRRYSEEFKAGVVAKCRQPGVSMAGVALAHGLNANLLRRWVEELKEEATAPVAPNDSDRVEPARFVPLPAPIKPTPSAASIRIEIARGPTRVVVQWPMEAAEECKAWLQDLLR